MMKIDKDKGISGCTILKCTNWDAKNKVCTYNSNWCKYREHEFADDETVSGLKARIAELEAEYARRLEDAEDALRDIYSTQDIGGEALKRKLCAVLVILYGWQPGETIELIHDKDGK